ncbi:nucleotide exchange factor GrpE [Patescibacteria group bacterium]|nr:nucleotide exchange factor GrpE [Patescibacteria group bacterium]
MKSDSQKIADKKVDEINAEFENTNAEITQSELMDLIKQLADSKNKEQRTLADYQNLVRRTQDERFMIAKLAAKDFIKDLIQPLAHLSLASEQINEVGLNMVISQLWQVLEQNGLKKIDCKNKKFDIETMEVIDKGKKGDKVIKIVKDGYMLNNEVIQHAKVILN